MLCSWYSWWWQTIYCAVMYCISFNPSFDLWKHQRSINIAQANHRLLILVSQPQQRHLEPRLRVLHSWDNDPVAKGPDAWDTATPTQSKQAQHTKYGEEDRDNSCWYWYNTNKIAETFLVQYNSSVVKQYHSWPSRNPLFRTLTFVAIRNSSLALLALLHQLLQRTTGFWSSRTHAPVVPRTPFPQHPQGVWGSLDDLEWSCPLKD